MLQKLITFWNDENSVNRSNNLYLQSAAPEVTVTITLSNFFIWYITFSLPERRNHMVFLQPLWEQLCSHKDCGNRKLVSYWLFRQICGDNCSHKDCGNTKWRLPNGCSHKFVGTDYYL